MKKLFQSAALMCVLGAGAAQAAPINLSYQQDGLFGSGDLQQVVRVHTSGTGYDGRARAGLFHLTGDGGFGDFVAFCVDLSQFLNNPQQAMVNNSLYSGVTLENMERLFSSALGGLGLIDVIDTSLEAAGLQVAIWEVMLDSGAAFDLSSGGFSVSENAAVKAQAQTYLDGLFNGNTGEYNLTFLESANHQDVVTVAPVPLPASVMMMIAGLGGLAAMRRRKTS